MRIEKTLHGTLSRAQHAAGAVEAQHAAGAAEPALGFGPDGPSLSGPSLKSQTRAAREPPTRNTFPDATSLGQKCSSLGPKYPFWSKSDGK